MYVVICGCMHDLAYICCFMYFWFRFSYTFCCLFLTINGLHNVSLKIYVMYRSNADNKAKGASAGCWHLAASAALDIILILSLLVGGNAGRQAAATLSEWLHHPSILVDWRLSRTLGVLAGCWDVVSSWQNRSASARLGRGEAAGADRCIASSLRSGMCIHCIRKGRGQGRGRWRCGVKGLQENGWEMGI